jgi:hypothetical protein
MMNVKEVVMIYFRLLSHRLPPGNEENTKRLSKNSRFPGQKSSPLSPESEAGVLITQPRIRVLINPRKR